MIVDTPLAVHTLILGWEFYGEIWETLSITGIVFLPFLGVLLRHLFLDRADGHAIEERPRAALVRFEGSIILMFLAAMFAGQPSSLTALAPGSLQYNAPNGTPAGVGTWGTAFALPGVVEVPPWWHLVMSLSSGINQAVKASMPPLLGLQDIEQAARLAYIKDPAVRQETSEFYAQCYLPAKARFLRDKPSGISPDAINWLGGEYLLETYYGKERSDGTVRGFPYDPVRDTEWDEPPSHGWGKPTCQQWWSGDTAVGGVGLRTKLVLEIEDTAPGLTGGLVAMLPGALTPQAVEDEAIRGLLTQDPPSDMDTSLYDARPTTMGGMFDFLQNIAANLTQFFAIFVELMLDLLVLGLPVMHALLLMAIFMLLPFGIVASGFSWSFVFQASILIFSVFFWSPIWHMVEWTQEQVMVALFPGGSGMGLVQMVLQGPLSPYGVTDGTKKAIVSLGFATLYVALPVVFSVLLSLAGSRAGSYLGSVLNHATRSSIAKATDRAAQTTEGIATTAVGQTTRVVSRRSHP
jgi:hypothetical protein